MIRNKFISERTINRLPKYLHYLLEMEARGFERVSSAGIAEALGTTASQVRQDLSAFGNYGAQGYGYSVARLIDEIKLILGISQKHQVAVIGIGSLGHALIEHLDFAKYGFHVFAGFDVNPDIIGIEINGVPILGMDELSKVLTESKVDICVLTVPQREAQNVATELETLNVPAIWNFTNVNLDLSAKVVVQNIDFLDSLFVLSYYLHNNRQYKLGR